MRHGVLAGFVQVHMRVDVVDPVHRDEVVLALGGGVLLGQLDAVLAFYVVDGADVLPIGSQHFHVFVDIGGHRHFLCSSVGR